MARMPPFSPSFRAASHHAAQDSGARESSGWKQAPTAGWSPGLIRKIYALLVPSGGRDLLAARVEVFSKQGAVDGGRKILYTLTNP